jgi:hypothetical protein
MQFEEFKEQVDKLKALVDDPQPGCIAWHMFLNQRMEALIALWTARSKA